MKTASTSLMVPGRRLVAEKAQIRLSCQRSWARVTLSPVRAGALRSAPATVPVGSECHSHTTSGYDDHLLYCTSRACAFREPVALPPAAVTPETRHCALSVSFSVCACVGRVGYRVARCQCEVSLLGRNVYPFRFDFEVEKMYVTSSPRLT